MVDAGQWLLFYLYLWMAKTTHAWHFVLNYIQSWPANINKKVILGHINHFLISKWLIRWPRCQRRCLPMIGPVLSVLILVAEDRKGNIFDCLRPYTSDSDDASSISFLLHFLLCPASWNEWSKITLGIKQKIVMKRYGWLLIISLYLAAYYRYYQ